MLVGRIKNDTTICEWKLWNNKKLQYKHLNDSKEMAVDRSVAMDLLCCCAVFTKYTHTRHTHKFIVCNFSRKKRIYWLWSFGHNAANWRCFAASSVSKMFRLCWIKCENTLRWCIENPWWCYEHWTFPPTCYIWLFDPLIIYWLIHFWWICCVCVPAIF